MQHGKPHCAIGYHDQPDAREGQAGRFGVAERFVVPMRSGNADGELPLTAKRQSTQGGTAAGPPTEFAAELGSGVRT